jgi:hypothetical protein
MILLNEKLQQELNSLRIQETQIRENLQIKNKNFSEIENFIDNFQQIIKNQAMKIEIKDNINKLFDKNFMENLKNFLEFFNSNEKNEIKILQHIELIIRSSFNQIENFEKNLIFQNEKISEISQKLKIGEKKISELNSIEQEKFDLAKSLKILEKKFEENNNFILEKKLEEDKNIQEFIKEISALKFDNKNKIEELNNLRLNLKDFEILFEKFDKEKNKFELNEKNLILEQKALQERIKIILKEKKYLENLLNTIRNSHPSNNHKRIINDIMNIFDLICNLERDKFKILQNLNNIDNELAKSSIRFNVNVNSSTNTNDNIYNNDYNNDNRLSLNLNYNNDHNLEGNKRLFIEKEHNNDTLNEYNYKIGNYILFNI